MSAESDAGAPFERFRFDGSDGDELAASRTLVPEPNPTMLRRLAERVAASHYTGYSVDRQKLLAWAVLNRSFIVDVFARRSRSSEQPTGDES